MVVYKLQQSHPGTHRGLIVSQRRDHRRDLSMDAINRVLLCSSKVLNPNWLQN
jgi:hypothetical protein